MVTLQFHFYLSLRGCSIWLLWNCHPMCNLWTKADVSGGDDSPPKWQNLPIESGAHPGWSTSLEGCSSVEISTVRCMLLAHHYPLQPAPLNRPARNAETAAARSSRKQGQETPHCFTKLWRLYLVIATPSPQASWLQIPNHYHLVVV